MSIDTRKSRELSLGLGYPEAESASSNAIPSLGESLTKDELKRVFKKELDAIVAEQLISSKKNMLDDLAAKNERILSDRLKQIELKEKQLMDSILTMKALISSVESSYQAKINNNIEGLDTVIVAVVMEVLYKIMGDAKSYKKAVIKIVGECLNAYKDDNSVKIRLSENDYRYIKREYEDDESSECLMEDKRLNDGQCIFDDGISIYETGVLDQLDTLRAIFIAKLRENHGS